VDLGSPATREGGKGSSGRRAGSPLENKRRRIRGPLPLSEKAISKGVVNWEKRDVWEEKEKDRKKRDTFPKVPPT